MLRAVEESVQKDSGYLLSRFNSASRVSYYNSEMVKNLQVNSKGTFVTLPQLRGSKLCPKNAFKAIPLDFPALGNAPLFFVPSGPINLLWHIFFQKLLHVVFGGLCFHYLSYFRWFTCCLHRFAPLVVY